MAASPADCGHVTVSGRTLALLTSPAALRRLRVAHRADALYGELRTISEIVLGRADATEIAVDADDGDAWIMTNDAADRLRVKPDTVRRMLREGRLRGTRRGQVWLVDAADLAMQEAEC